MKKAWSITTTLRNPERLRNFLIVLKQLENSEWNTLNQKKYQILLIQNRLYGYRNQQFYNGLDKDTINLIADSSKDISFKQAEKIFMEKSYTDPAMRGRLSINPLIKIGLVFIKNGQVKITNLGELFLKEDFDFGEIFFRSFLKWQIPNPNSRGYPKNKGYDIKPFIGTLHLIKAVNQKEIARSNKAKGINKKEFDLFIPTLVDHKNINIYADKIIALRDKISLGKTKDSNKIFDIYSKQFVRKFLSSKNKKEQNKLLNNLKDYGDNAIRYFRLTRYIYIRGGGYYIDLEPRRAIEIDSLLAYDNAQSKLFESKEEYISYLSDISKPQLPWETKEKYIEIIKSLIEEIQKYEFALQKKIVIKDFQRIQLDELKTYITELRVYRRQLQDEENHKKSQTTEQIKYYIETLEQIYNFDNRPILLEKISALGLSALNDAIKIKPNYPVGDDNEPTFTAPANTPDIECFYESFNAICEVTMLKSRDQWYNEGQPVMRHLRDFEGKNTSKLSYGLFIAPILHRDTINTFWTAIKYEYEGSPQKIIPLSIKNFISILKILLQMKIKDRFLKHTEISHLYNKILDASNSFNNSSDWIQSIPDTISSWGKDLISQT